jgi:hypothetical protein
MTDARRVVAYNALAQLANADELLKPLLDIRLEPEALHAVQSIRRAPKRSAILAAADDDDGFRCSGNVDLDSMVKLTDRGLTR